MALPQPRPYRASDIWDMPADGNRYEIIDGELYVSASPVPEHQAAIVALVEHLAPHIRRHSLGRLFVAPITVSLTPFAVVQPDLIFIARDRLNVISERGIDGPPDVVVEVLSPSTRLNDLNVKRDLYAASGVRQYWIIEPRDRSVEIFTLVDRRYTIEGHFSPGEAIRPTLFPGLEIPVDQL